ncbi:MAG: DegV family protein [Oscillospiraceae bacterium]
MGRRIAITTDCTSDLTPELLKRFGVDVIYFYIYTDTGKFQDVSEITAANVFECMQRGGVTRSVAPDPEEYKRFFEKNLKTCDEVIHVAISSGISLSCTNSAKAVELMGENGSRVHIFDTWQLSTGVGHLVIRAAELAAAGKGSEQIIAELSELRSRVSTTFITMNAEYLYLNGKVSKTVERICDRLKIHPVLEMRDGQIKLKKVFFGNYENAMLRYIRSQLRRYSEIDSGRLFITHAGCNIKELNAVQKTVSSMIKFNEVYVTVASATISSNCGPHTIGVLYINKP